MTRLSEQLWGALWDGRGIFSAFVPRLLIVAAFQTGIPALSTVIDTHTHRHIHTHTRMHALNLWPWARSPHTHFGHFCLRWYLLFWPYWSHIGGGALPEKLSQNTSFMGSGWRLKLDWIQQQYWWGRPALLSLYVSALLETMVLLDPSAWKRWGELFWMRKNESKSKQILSHIIVIYIHIYITLFYFAFTL